MLQKTGAAQRGELLTRNELSGIIGQQKPGIDHPARIGVRELHDRGDHMVVPDSYGIALFGKIRAV